MLETCLRLKVNENVSNGKTQGFHEPFNNRQNIRYVGDNRHRYSWAIHDADYRQ